MWFSLFSVSVYFLRRQIISKSLGNLKFDTPVNGPLALAFDLKWGPKKWESGAYNSTGLALQRPTSL